MHERNEECEPPLLPTLLPTRDPDAICSRSEIRTEPGLFVHADREPRLLFVSQMVERLKHGDIDTLLGEATGERLWAEGNASGEMLN